MAFYFFTEPSKLNVQTQSQAFGAIDEDNYRLNNLFTASSNAKAYAIASGNVLVQPITGSTTLVNVVVKPIDQPDLNLPKIDYIIYKGVEKSSLISTTKVASPTNNDLTRKIWESHADLLAEMPDAPPEPLAKEALGFGYSATETGAYKALDTDGLDAAFYHNENTLFPVEAGDHIGDFNSASFGCLLVLEKIGQEATFKIARELDSKIIYTALGSGATQAEVFRRKHDKESILAFMDSSAFFSAFDGADIKVTSDGTTFEEKSPEDFYTDVTEKHFNKNTVYFDIRNENLDSFNYYENYSDVLKLDLVGADTYEEVDYYRDKWPLLAVKDTEFDTANTNKTLGVSLYKGDNEFPQFFLKKGKLLNIDLEDEKNVSLRFLEHEIDEEEENYQMVEKLQIPKSDSGFIKSNYFQLRYIKRYATPDTSYAGVALKNESFLDNLFPIFDMKLPYVNAGSVDVKMFTDACYVDKVGINDLDFTVNLGIARDNQGISFMALPETYNSEELQESEKPPFYSEQTFGGGTFFDYFNKKLTDNKIRQSVFENEEDEYEFLAFSEALLDEVVVDPGTSTVEDDINLEPSALGLEYDFENFNIFSLTNDEYSQLETAKNTEFTAPYKVYLGIANTEALTIDDDEKSTTFYALRGLKENGAGEIVSHEYISNIKVFAIDDLYNWDAAAEKKCIIEFEKKEPGYTAGDYGFDWLRSNYRSILKSNTQANREALEQVYELKQIAGKDYRIPWLSMKLNQSVTLKLDRTFRKKSEFTTIAITPNPNFTIAPVDFKEDREITITCIGESPNPTELVVMADGAEAGALNIMHKPFKKVELEWIFVEWKGTNIDENALTAKVSLANVNDYVEKGTNPALLEPDVLNATPKILDIADLWANRNTQSAAIKSAIETRVANLQATFDGTFTPGQNSTPKIEATEATEISFLTNLAQLYTIQNQINNVPPIFSVIKVFFGEMTCIKADGGEVNGFSFTSQGYTMMNMKNPTTNISRDLPHEVLHAIDLDHSFDTDATHSFDEGRTDNIMDYNNTPRHTWKWQWDDMYNSQYAKDI